MVQSLESALAVAERSRVRKIVEIVLFLALLAIVALVLDLSGIDISGWLEHMLDRVAEISPGWVALGLAFQTAETLLTGLAWIGILRFAYGREAVPALQVIAAYAVAVALNGVLPASLGLFVMLMMLLAIVPGSTFAGVFSALLVSKIFFVVVGVVLYLYLFVSVEGTFSARLGSVSRHPLIFSLIIAGSVLLIALVLYFVGRKARKLWEQAKAGAAILSSPRAYLTRVVLPEAAGYVCRFAVIAVFLAAYSIPVSLQSVLYLAGSNSVSGAVSPTPGGVGVNQTLNVAALHGEANSERAAAFSVGHQLITTSWNIALAIGLVIGAFGWLGGPRLVKRAYVEARDRIEEEHAKKT